MHPLLSETVARGFTGQQIARLMRALTGLILVVSMSIVPPLAAQEASPYVPLQHWTMPYVEHLIARGVIPDPTPLTRPLKRADLVRVLRGVDTLAVGAKVAQTVRRLLAALDVPGHGPRYRVAGDVGIAAATYARRDPLAAIDDTGPRQAGPELVTVSGGVGGPPPLRRGGAGAHPDGDQPVQDEPACDRCQA